MRRGAELEFFFVFDAVSFAYKKKFSKLQYSVKFNMYSR